MSLATVFDRHYAPGGAGAVFAADPTTDAEAERGAAEGRALLAGVLVSTRLTGAFAERRMTHDRRGRALVSLIASAKAELQAVTRVLIDGAATLAGWFDRFRRLLVPANFAAGFLGLGDADPPPADLGAIRGQSDRQLAFLSRFRRAVATGAQLLDGMGLMRAGLYASALWGVAEASRRARAIRDGFTEEERVLGDPFTSHCPQCPPLADRWAPIGTLPAIGDTVCQVHCQCYFLYR